MSDQTPSVTPQAIEDEIVSEWYLNAGECAPCDDFHGPVPSGSPLYLLTICVLVLRNGFTVTGESACASPENFNSEIGRRIARENAVAKVWPLLGYALKEKLACAS